MQAKFGEKLVNRLFFNYFIPELDLLFLTSNRELMSVARSYGSNSDDLSFKLYYRFY